MGQQRPNFWSELKQGAVILYAQWTNERVESAHVTYSKRLKPVLYVYYTRTSLQFRPKTPPLFSIIMCAARRDRILIDMLIGRRRRKVIFNFWKFMRLYREAFPITALFLFRKILM